MNFDNIVRNPSERWCVEASVKGRRRLETKEEKKEKGGDNFWTSDVSSVSPKLVLRVTLDTSEIYRVCRRMRMCI